MRRTEMRFALHDRVEIIHNCPRSLRPSKDGCKYLPGVIRAARIRFAETDLEEIVYTVLLDKPFCSERRWDIMQDDVRRPPGKARP